MLETKLNGSCGRAWESSASVSKRWLRPVARLKIKYLPSVPMLFPISESPRNSTLVISFKSTSCVEALQRSARSGVSIEMSSYPLVSGATQLSPMPISMLQTIAVIIIPISELVAYDNIATAGVQKERKSFLFLCSPLQAMAAMTRAMKPNNKERMPNSTPQNIKVNSIPMCNDVIFCKGTLYFAH